MLNYLWAGMIAVGILWGAFHGNLAAVTNGALEAAKEAVTLCLTMLGIMSCWCGILKIRTDIGADRKNETGDPFPVSQSAGGSPGGIISLHEYDRKRAGTGLGGNSCRIKGYGGAGKAGGTEKKKRGNSKRDGQ